MRRSRASVAKRRDASAGTDDYARRVAETRERRRPSRRVRRNRTILVAVLAIAAIAAVLGGAAVAGSNTSAESDAADAASARPSPKLIAPPEPRPEPAATEPPASVDTFDMNAHSIDDPMSIWVVSNRARPLDPIDFVPPDLVDVPVAHTWAPLLRQEASDAIVDMFDAARDEADLYLASNSAYRSYETQVELYGDGSDPTTAPPGASEHQTGLTMDIGTEGGCTFECMGDSVEGQWLVDNAYRFGFLLRYPADKVAITGYPYEPWHYRYIGPELAGEMHERGVTTLEEFFGLPAVDG